MDINQLYFPVEKVALSQITKGVFETPSGMTHAIVATKPDGQKRLLTYCSNKYTLLKNEDIFIPLLNEVQKNFNIKVKARMDNYSKFFVDIILQGTKLGFGPKKNDDIVPKIRIYNSYDKSLIYRHRGGMHRLVCTNGLTLPIEELSQQRSLHTPSLNKVMRDAKSLMETLEILQNNYEELCDTYFEIYDQSVGDIELRVEEVVENTKFPIHFTGEVIERIMQERNTLGLKNFNDWLVYNGFNYSLNHNEDMPLTQDKREKLDETILDYLFNY